MSHGRRRALPGGPRTLRYGARRGQTGGEGALVEWEPPSFQLTAYESRLVPPPGTMRSRASCAMRKPATICAMSSARCSRITQSGHSTPTCPGGSFFRGAFDEFGPHPVIAEDLGLLTPNMRALSASCGFPEMDIPQFADGGDPLSGWAPLPEKVAYTGTHDNLILVGFCKLCCPHLDARETATTLMETVASCPAPVAHLPPAGPLILGDEVRMNTSGVAEGNWSWHADRLPERK